MIKRALLALAASALTLGWVGAVPSAHAATFTACDGVWVMLDYGSLGGGVKTSCATSFSTGTAALRSAGFAPTLDDGFVTQITSQPAKPNIQKAYWSYWHAERKSDGSYGTWSYSTAGSNAYHPNKGNAEGWHYINLSDTASGPSTAPPKNPAAAPATTRPTPRPSASKSTAQPHPSPSKATASSTKPSPQASAIPAASAVPSPQATATPAASSGTGTSGSPLPLIITVTVIVAGGAGAGAWWLWKGRKP